MNFQRNSKEFPKNSQRIPKEFPKNSQKNPKEFPKNPKMIEFRFSGFPKVHENFQNLQYTMLPYFYAPWITSLNLFLVCNTICNTSFLCSLDYKFEHVSSLQYNMKYLIFLLLELQVWTCLENLICSTWSNDTALNYSPSKAR